jgi:NACHT domain- and WD repeat-containing protein
LRHGARFQAIDLRWGVSDEASKDQQTMKICLGELARCQKMTPRPNFILLLADRYGWCPLPTEIVAQEFELIPHQPATGKLKQWY